MRRLCSRLPVVLLCAFAPWTPFGAESFSVATYNLENYLDLSIDSRPAKTAAAKAKIRESIGVIRPEVLALQEVGSTNALLELRGSLRRDGMDYPHWEHVTGFDTNIHVAVLSRFPIVARRPHTREGFLLQGRRFRVSRGFAEVDIRVTPNYTFTLITAHLKSKRPVPQADEADLREQEALVLREIIDARLKLDPEANLIVLGDLNDVKDARSTRAVIGRGRHALVDTRPAERNGDNQPSSVAGYAPRNITWTHFYGKEDTYSRIDYILLSKGMAREWATNGTYLLALPNWGVGSDHRPIVASFVAEDR
ncbi:MAG: endonuclease/exonuclease/phosphatase family protein [Verrucomicrobia bacterium]|nr:endonuclease/exonuclease/phosphatase family protein [Verrucomicrobiota bacterium]